MPLAHEAKAIAATLCTLIAFMPASSIAAKPSTRNRAEIPDEFRWDFSAIYPSWAAWDGAMLDMEAKMEAFAKLKGTLAQGPATVLKPYRDFDDIGKQQYLVYRYPQLQRDVETRDQAMASRFQRVGTVFAKFDTATSWFTPELLKVPQPTIENWTAETLRWRLPASRMNANVGQIVVANIAGEFTLKRLVRERAPVQTARRKFKIHSLAIA